MLKDELVPVKNQKFDIGRTINFTKCKCDKCDFLHCDNYAKKMQLRKFKNAKEFVECWKEQNPQIAKLIYDDPKAFEILLVDFLERMISFPKGLYWKFKRGLSNNEVLSIDICRQSRSEYEWDTFGDFTTLANVRFDMNYNKTKYTSYTHYYPHFSDRARKLADRISSGLNEVFELLQK